MKPKSTNDSDICGKVDIPLRLTEFLPYRLNVAATVVSQGLSSLYGSSLGIGIPEWRVLATVGEYKRITAKEVGQHSEMGKVKVSRAALSLEKRGLIQREPNTDDLRESYLTLTESGRSAYEEIAPAALAYESYVIAGISPADIRVFNKVIDHIVAKTRNEKSKI